MLGPWRQDGVGHFFYPVIFYLCFISYVRIAPDCVFINRICAEHAQAFTQAQHLGLLNPEIGKVPFTGQVV